MGSKRKTSKKETSTPSYQVGLSSRAEREFGKLPADVQQEVYNALRRLEENPRPDGVRKLKGEDDLYRIAVKSYRVIYTIDDGKLVVLAIRIAHRREVYKKKARRTEKIAAALGELRQEVLKRGRKGN